MADIPKILGGRYEVGDLIGRGGMAQVHRGYDTRLSRAVAIKILRADLASDPTFLARFRREAQSAAALNHPSIVSVYDTGEEQVTGDGGTISLPYIVMEYVKGRTVSSLLSSGDPLPIDEAIQIVVGVLSALEYSHQEGIIHRDIKPGNIMLTASGKVKVMDFGIARAIADSAATMTATNSVVGTAQYLSPEQARGEVVDTRSDLYSTGCLFYELLTGRPPFVGDSAVAVAYQHVSETPKPPSYYASDIPEALDRVVLKALAKKRDERYQSANQFRADLLNLQRGEAVSAPSVDSWAKAAGAAGAGAGAASAAAAPLPPSVPATTISPNSPFHPTGQFPAFGSGAGTQVMPGAGGTQVMPGAGMGGSGMGNSGMGGGMAGPGMNMAGFPSSQFQAQPKKRNTTWMIVVGLLLLAVAVGAVVWAVVSSGNDPEPKPTVQQVKVPSLTGLDQNAARKALSDAGLKFNLGEPTPSDTIPEGQYVSSEPEVGTSVEAGSTVTVRFSSGAEMVVIPDLSNQTQEAARQALKQLGLIPGQVTTEDAPNKKKDDVIRTEPAATTKVAKGTEVQIVVATGFVNVESLVNTNVDEAKKYLNSLGLNVTLQTFETNGVAPNLVVSQSPDPGRVEIGSSVELTYSIPDMRPTTPPTSEPSAKPTGGTGGGTGGDHGGGTGGGSGGGTGGGHGGHGK